jgi:hypothetical protein
MKQRHDDMTKKAASHVAISDCFLIWLNIVFVKRHDKRASYIYIGVPKLLFHKPLFTLKPYLTYIIISFISCHIYISNIKINNLSDIISDIFIMSPHVTISKNPINTGRTGDMTECVCKLTSREVL